jgi:hypothetical protein
MAPYISFMLQEQKMHRVKGYFVTIKLAAPIRFEYDVSVQYHREDI